MPVLLYSPADAYMVQAAPLLAVLDDLGAELFVGHPGAAVAYRVTLRDEPAFRTWLDEPKPGRIRIIQRADGFEVQTNIGKLPGGDPNGPTVPLRGGVQDLMLLRRGLLRLKERFKTADEVCVVPSFGMELKAVATAFSSTYKDEDEPIFGALCLVYPRPPR